MLGRLTGTIGNGIQPELSFSCILEIVLLMLIIVIVKSSDRSNLPYIDE